MIIMAVMVVMVMVMESSKQNLCLLEFTAGYVGHKYDLGSNWEHFLGMQRFQSVQRILESQQFERKRSHCKSSCDHSVTV